MRQVLRNRVDGDRLFVVPNGVDVDLLQPVPADVRDQARLKFAPAGGPLVAYIGTFQPYEGLELLVRAVPAIAAMVPSVRVAFAGSGVGASALRNEIARAGVGGRVTLLGHLPLDEVRQLYAAADLLVYPRRLTETTALTTPLKPLEAMAMEKCVLASDIEPLRELFKPGESGEVFRPGDAADLGKKAVELLRDDKRRAALGRAARATVVRERQWRTIVDGYQAVYATACARSRSQPRAISVAEQSA
jgi:glycosyltransferase involved in cell wall biosynthesis